MSTTLVLTDPIVAELEAKARLPVETGGVLLARHHCTGNGNVRLLGRSLHWVPESAYRQRSRREIVVNAEGYTVALSGAEQDRAVPVWVHTHPGGCPLPSLKDQRVDAAIADVFRLRSGSDFYATVIASPSSTGVELTGTVQPADAQPKAIDRFWIVGDRWRLHKAFNQMQDGVDMTMFDRSVLAFGKAVQETIGMLNLAVVGCGGTGSAVAEQLVRLGAKQLLLVDVDTLSNSNVTRVYGSTPAKVGQLKTDVLAAHLRTIAPDLRCSTIRGMCATQQVGRSLTDMDLIFGCTDDNAGRLVLSRLSTYYLIPVIDVGILLSSDGQDLLTGIDGRITVLSPGNACLLCRGRIDVARAAAEVRSPEERSRLADEGYAPALGRLEPAVIAFTTMVASVAISELLERLIGYGHQVRPSEILLRLHDREISTNIVTPRPGHYCDPAAGKLGRGDATPFLEQLWAS